MNRILPGTLVLWSDGVIYYSLYDDSQSRMSVIHYAPFCNCVYTDCFGSIYIIGVVIVELRRAKRFITVVKWYR